MKRILISIAAVFLWSTCAFAGLTVKALKDSSGTAITSYTLTNGVAVYSEKIRLSNNVEFATLLVVEDKVGGTGDVDISMEYSADGSNWYPAYTTNMSGTITVEGNIVTALQNASRWIVFTPRLAAYMRYKFDPDADSRITATHLHQEAK